MRLLVRLGSSFLRLARLWAAPVACAAIALLACASANATIPITERQALLALYAGTNGDGWTNNSGWNGVAGTECNWYGVYCDGTSTHVVDISLRDNNLSGTLPDLIAFRSLGKFNVQLNKLRGAIPSVSGLTTLVELYLDHNEFSGTVPSLDGLSSLAYFDASHNQLSGRIPAIQSLSSLRLISLANNQLSGPLPALAGLSNLDWIEVHDNLLSGPIPSLEGLVSLRVFWANDNHLSGTIPPLQGLPSLYFLSIPNNELTGSIPAIAGLSNLWVVSLRNNRLTGPLPNLSGLPELFFFVAAQNDLSGPMPSLAGLSKLDFFDVADNHISGSIPSLAGLSSIARFYIYDNDLSGPIPSLAGLDRLDVFWANDNDLTGSLPSLAGLGNLGFFSASNNHLTGSIPPLNGLAKLYVFAVDNNTLTGSLPSLSDVSRLEYLSVHNNQLSGRIPDLSALSALRSLYLHNNRFDGMLSVPVSQQLYPGGSRLCPNLFDRSDNAVFDFATGMTPWWRDCVTNGPLLISGTLNTAALQLFSATEQSSRYEWSVDGSEAVGRIGSADTLQAQYPTEFNGTVSVRYVQPSGSTRVAAVPLKTDAPRISVVAGAPVQLCGNADPTPQPGELFSVPLTATNNGALALRDGVMFFAPTDRVDAAAQGQSVTGKLTMAAPTVDLGTLAPRTSKPSDQVPGSLAVSVFVQSDAQCGASYGVRFLGSADASSFSIGQAPPVATLTLPAGPSCVVVTGCNAVAASAQVAKSVAAPRQGFYFNPNRPGNGLSSFLLPQAVGPSVFFGTWFTGDSDHQPTWYIIQGPMVAGAVIAPIYRFRRDLTSSTFAVHGTIVGHAVVTHKSAEDLVLFWQLGNRSGLELMKYFVGGPAPVPNRTGAWYNPSEPGWGQVVHQYVVGEQIHSFVANFIYDAAGEPRWVLMQGPASELASSALSQTYQIHCPGCAWLSDWSNHPIATGTASQLLIDATNGRTSTTFLLPEPYGGAWNRSNLPLQILTDPQ